MASSTDQHSAQSLFPRDATDALVHQLAAAFSGREDEVKDLGERISDRPALLWPERWPELNAFAEAQSGGARQAVLNAVDVLQDFEAQIAAKPGWATGGGPIKKLAAQVFDGVMSEDEARRILVGPDMIWRMSPDYVRRCASRAAYLAQTEQWPLGVILGRLTIDAADHYPVEEVRREMHFHAIKWWIGTVTSACIEVPDGALFANATARGLELLAEQQAAGDVERLAGTLFSLGVLHLDPYQARKDPGNIQAELKWWKQRFIERYGEQAFEDEARRMPEVLEAMKAASQYLAEAAALQQGADRGRSLKARADAIALIERLGGPADHKLLGQCVREALELLPENDFPGQVLTLRSYVGFFGLDIQTSPHSQPADLVRLEQSDLSALIGEEGYIAVYERFKAAAASVEGVDPNRAVQLLLRIWPHLRETEKNAAARQILKIMADSAGSAALERNGGDYSQAVVDVANLPVDDRLWPIVALAVDAMRDSREGEVLSLAEQAIQLGEMEDSRLGDVFRLLLAWLLIGEAVNRAQSGRWAGSTGYYCAALRISAEMGMLESVSNILANCADAAVHEGHEGSAALTVTLAALAPRLARADVPRLGDLVHQTWLTLLAHELGNGRLNPVHFNLQIQAIKGATFAAMVHSRTLYDARNDATAMELLRQRSAIGAAEGLSDVGLHEYVLISHHAEAAPEGPVGAVERLAQRFDGHVVSNLASGNESLEIYLDEEEWAANLDPSDLLIDQFIGSDEQGASAIIIGLHSVAGRQFTAGKGGLPIRHLELTVEDRVLESNVFGLAVAQLREALQEHPGPAIATDEAFEGLASVADYFKGAFPILREESARGRTHLCFVPHRAYHFCPLHLVPDAEGILADRWTVTYLPHPALLRRRNLPLPDDKNGVAAFAMSFVSGEHGLGPLPGSVDEAAAIARAMGGRAWIDADATEENLLEALETCRYVHISTHGQQNVFAPMLQQLFLAPSASSDGIFHAYEVLGKNLAHVELVTLSACETALGRFDINDNLRGLVATLLIAGVRTVISTLWPVRDAVTGHFFEALYARLATRDAKLAAFRSAQIETRKAFPAFRDWGAFTFTGSW